MKAAKPRFFLPIFKLKSTTVLFSFFIFGLKNLSFGQANEQPEHIEFIEKYFQEYDFAGETDIQTLVETFRFYLENPLDLNRPDREQFRELLIFSDLQIENLLAHRARLGKLKTIFELQSIAGWESDEIRRALPFVKIGADPPVENFKKLWNAAKTEAIFRCNSPIEIPGESDAEGNRLGTGFRLRHQTGNQFSVGILGEKDPGEAFFRGSNARGFDFYSAHFFVKNLSPRLKTLAVGDFAARFGQSVLLNSGFAIGKTAESINILRSGEKLLPYTSFGESRFFRGAAATFLLAKNWELTTFLSNRNRDANIDEQDFPDDLPPDFQSEIDFSAFQNTGLHRTPSEIFDEKSVREKTVGASLKRTGQRGEISANLLKVDFDKPLLPGSDAYRKFEFSGKKYFGSSFDYRFSAKNFIFFGENAFSKNGKMAAVNGFLAGLDRRISVAVLHRFFDVRYQNLYGTPFAETRNGQNEQGVYFGLEIRPIRRWQINAFADVWKNDWLRFQTDAPSTGQEFLVRVQYSIRKKMLAHVRFSSEKKMKNASDGLQNGLENHQKKRARAEVEFFLNSNLATKTRLEWAFYQVENQEVRHGFMAFQEFSWRKIGLPISATGRFGLFDTDDTDSRIYAFERDIFAALSVPGWSGRGTRFYLNLNWKINSRLQLESRWASIFRLKTVAETQKQGWENEWKMQLRWRLGR